jgi:hypothetical protein
MSPQKQLLPSVIAMTAYCWPLFGTHVSWHAPEL